jgi:hypothetical protein
MLILICIIYRTVVVVSAVVGDVVVVVVVVIAVNVATEVVIDIKYDLAVDAVVEVLMILFSVVGVVGVDLLHLHYTKFNCSGGFTRGTGGTFPRAQRVKRPTKGRF